jgi:TolB protein
MMNITKKHSILRIFVGLIGMIVAAGGGVIAQDELTSFIGQIAYIGDDYNVYTYNGQTQQTEQLTDDAAPRRHYEYPVWSTDGRLAYFCCNLNAAREPIMEVYVSPEGSTEGDLSYEGENEVFTYASWSPANCKTGENCRYLAVLISRLNAPGFKLELLETEVDDAESRTIGTGAPYYSSWSPDGTEMIWQRNNRQLNRYDIERDNIFTLDQAPGFFSAPMWSPVDDRILIGELTRDGLTTDLVIIEGTKSTALVEDVEGIVAFNWSPDGQAVAYRTIQRNGYQEVVVIDATSGAEITRSAMANVVAFFWSPDSEKIAYVSIVRDDGSSSASLPNIRVEAIFAQQDPLDIRLGWSVMNVAAGDERDYSVFIPTDEMLYLLTYFDQFAQSHQLWSPDSAALVYTELKAETLQPTISILDISGQNPVPFSLADGVFAVWSYQ